MRSDAVSLVVVNVVVIAFIPFLKFADGSMAKEETMKNTNKVITDFILINFDAIFTKRNQK